MQECRVCGLLFLGGGACPNCGSQVALDISVDDLVLDDETIPGLEEIADAIGDATAESSKSEVLPFGLGAKAEVIESSLPFGVGSFTSEVTEVAIPYAENDVESEIQNGQEQQISLPEVSSEIDSFEEEQRAETTEQLTPTEPLVSTVIETTNNEIVVDTQNGSSAEITSGDSHSESSRNVDATDITIERVDEIHNSIGSGSQPLFENSEFNDEPVSVAAETVLAEGVPDMWKIDAAEVDMDAIYSQEEQIIEVTFDNEFQSDDVQVSFDDFHHSPVEESMASDDDAPELHPAKALAVESSGQPEITNMINSAFEFMANSSWMQAAQVLSTASNNRPNDPAILNNLGLALLQSALEMDSKNDPMSSSQYEAAIMALRQGAKVDSNNNTILLNLSHALLVSGRAEKALKVINVLRGREANNLEVENVLGACLIQLGRDDEAQSILQPFASDSVVAGNLDLI